jgi:hypothetical protein
VVISVLAPCVFVGGHSGSLPSGGAAIGPWLAPARHTVTRLSDRGCTLDCKTLCDTPGCNTGAYAIHLVAIPVRHIHLFRTGTADCNTGANVYTSGFFSRRLTLVLSCYT